MGDSELDALRQARMMQMQSGSGGGGEAAAKAEQQRYNCFP